VLPVALGAGLGCIEPESVLPVALGVGFKIGGKAPTGLGFPAQALGLELIAIVLK